MLSVLSPFLSMLCSVFRSRAALQLRPFLGGAPQHTDLIDHGGSSLLGMVVRTLGRLAIRAGHRQTRDRHRLAPQRLPFVLDLEGSARKNRKARSLVPGPPVDSNDEPCQPTLGCAAHSRRTAETRHRGRRNQYRQVHGPSSQTTDPNVAHLSGEPHQPTGLRRFLYGADYPLPGSVRISGAGP
jgi:hypothetical protein